MEARGPAKEGRTRSEELSEAGFWVSMAFAAVTALNVAAGDPLIERAVLFGLWLVGNMAAAALGRSGRPWAAAWAMCFAGWAVLALIQWGSGCLGSTALGGHILLIMAGAVAGGGRLAAALCVACLANAAAMEAAMAWGWAPTPIFGRALPTMAASHMGMLAIAAVGGVALADRMRKARAEREEMGRRMAETMDGFKELFMKSPAPMALTEAAPRPGERSRRMVAANAAFEKLFGAPVEKMLASPAGQAALWASGGGLEEIRADVARSGASEGRKAKMRTWGGRRDLVCQVAAAPVAWEGRGSVLWTFQDVTEAERLRVEMERLNAELSRGALEKALEARRDPLTKLPNRRALSERLAEVDAWPDVPFAALMVDVDHFKKFNDALGHDEGDACLAQVSKALLAAAAAIGPGAFVARYGGEEFVVALDGFGRERAMEAASRICREVEAACIPHPDNEGRQKVTVSVGAAARRPGERAADAIRAADAALYESKRAGRARASWGERRQ